MKTLVLVLSAFVVSVTSGCASLGPKLSDVRKDVPAIRKGEARLYVYRESAFMGMGAAVQPEIKLNDKPIGTAVPDTVRFIDVQPGTYKLSCSTEMTHDVQVTLSSGETKYVRLVTLPGLLVGHIGPKLVPADEGQKAIEDMTLIMPQQMKDRVPASLYKAD